MKSEMAIVQYPKTGVSHLDRLVNMGLAQRIGDCDLGEMCAYDFIEEGVANCVTTLRGVQGKALADLPSEGALNMSNGQFVKRLLAERWEPALFSRSENK